MVDLVEKRWSRYGKDRVYVQTAEGMDVGHIDLQTRRIVATHTEFEGALLKCLERWCPPEPEGTPEVPSSTPITSPWAPPQTADHDLGSDPVSGPVESPWPEPTIAVVEPTTLLAASLPDAAPSTRGPSDSPLTEVCDLADNVAGAAARAKRNEVNAQAPVLNLVARAFGVKTEERNWRVGTKGEVKVGRQLEKLGDGWHRIHAVPVGENGSDIDHVVIGPAGVFTLNTKRHPGAKVWVGERAVMVNGHKTDYLRNSRYEADRTRKLLSDACGFQVPVTPVIVFVDLDSFKVKQMPPDVYVTYRRQVVAWLRSLPHTLDTNTVEMIFAKARINTSWLPTKL